LGISTKSLYHKPEPERQQNWKSPGVEEIGGYSIKSHGQLLFILLLFVFFTNKNVVLVLCQLDPFIEYTNGKPHFSHVVGMRLQALNIH
jgi:hypothetical protein